MRVLDALLAFPALLLAILVVATFGSGLGTVVVALGVIYVPAMARLVRSVTLVHARSRTSTRLARSATPTGGSCSATSCPTSSRPWSSSRRSTSRTRSSTSPRCLPRAGPAAAGSRLGLDARRRALVPAPEPVAGDARRASRSCSRSSRCNLIGDGLRSQLDPQGARAMTAAHEGRRVAGGGHRTAGDAAARGPRPRGRVPHERGSGPCGERRVARDRGGRDRRPRRRVRDRARASRAGRSWASCRRRRAASGASITLDGDELVGIPEKRYRRIRGERIGMVFQDPMTALEPAVLAPGSRSRRRCGSTSGMGQREARGARGDLFADVGLPDARRGRRPVSPRALRRDAPAGDDRDGARLRAGAPHRGRAHDRARRHHPGADPRAPARPRPGPRDGAAPHHPRPRGRPGAVPAGDRSVRGPDRGGRRRSSRCSRRPTIRTRRGSGRPTPRSRRAGRGCRRSRAHRRTRRASRPAARSRRAAPRPSTGAASRSPPSSRPRRAGSPRATGAASWSPARCPSPGRIRPRDRGSRTGRCSGSRTCASPSPRDGRWPTGRTGGRSRRSRPSGASRSRSVAARRSRSSVSRARARRRPRAASCG